MSQKILGPTSNPQLSDILNKIKLDIGVNLNCVQVATIVAYDATKCTCSCKINYKRVTDSGIEVDYPPLADCPVFFLTGGSSYISMPIQAGDTCIVLFNDRDLDDWWLSGGVFPPNTQRTHSLSDGMVLVGVRSQANKITLKTNVVEIYGGTNKVALGNATLSLKTALDNLMTALTSMTIGPTNIPVSAASVVSLNLVKAQIDSILDVGSSI